jgi:hypothetical protein
MFHRTHPVVIRLRKDRPLRVGGPVTVVEPDEVAR